MKNKSFLSRIAVVAVIVVIILVVIFAGKNKETTKITNNTNNENNAVVNNNINTPTNTQTKIVCGDGIIESPEQCDGIVPVEATCKSKGFDTGNVKCLSNCTLDYSLCEYTPKCTDNDNGITYNVKGTVFAEKNGIKSNYTDYCRSSSEGYIMEYYCNDTSVASIKYECPSECDAGRCY